MTTPRRALLAVLCVAFFGVSPLAQSAGTSGIASNAEIQKILAERVDTYRQSVGVVVGVIEPSGWRIVTYGRRSASATTPLDGDTESGQQYASCGRHCAIAPSASIRRRSLRAQP